MLVRSPTRHSSLTDAEALESLEFNPFLLGLGSDGSAGTTLTRMISRQEAIDELVEEPDNLGAYAMAYWHHL
jgi:hypothetical protein